MWDASGLGGDRIKVAEPVASRKIRRGRHLGLGGGTRTSKTHSEGVMAIVGWAGSGYHPLAC